MVPIRFNVTLDPEAPAVLGDTVTFETGATLAEVSSQDTFAYNHHGGGFGDAHPGALTSFYEDLVLGRPFPLQMVAHRVDGMDTIVAMALFLHRDLVLLPRTIGFVGTVDFLHRRGLTVVGHVDPDLEQLVYALHDVPEGSVEGWLPHAIDWVREYLQTGATPGTPTRIDVRVIERGTTGYVFATTARKRDLLRGWIELYRQGFLRGFLLTDDVAGRRHVLASHKSPYVSFQLERAAMVLNEMESAMGEPVGWAVDQQWLSSPYAGTFILPEHLSEVFTRI